jgi:putative drug exporter of the RND superfamily
VRPVGQEVKYCVAAAQVGTTIGLGLLFDTLVVRSLMTPAIATLLGRWFWWPQRVRSRPAKFVPSPASPVTAPVRRDPNREGALP